MLEFPCAFMRCEYEVQVERVTSVRCNCHTRDSGTMRRRQHERPVVCKARVLYRFAPINVERARAVVSPVRNIEYLVGERATRGREIEELPSGECAADLAIQV